MSNVKTSVALKRRFRKFKTVKGNEKVSFRSFVRKLKADGDSQADLWLQHKSAAVNKVAKEARQKNKGSRIASEKSATKLARRKKSERSRSQEKSS